MTNGLGRLQFERRHISTVGVLHGSFKGLNLCRRQSHLRRRTIYGRRNQGLGCDGFYHISSFPSRWLAEATPPQVLPQAMISRRRPAVSVVLPPGWHNPQPTAPCRETPTNCLM